MSDISQTHELLHGEEKVVHANAGYIGVEQQPEISAGHGGVEWLSAVRRGKLKAIPESWVKDLTMGLENLKGRTRALMEHPFHIVRNIFQFRKVRYRRLRSKASQKNTRQPSNSLKESSDVTSRGSSPQQRNLNHLA